MGLTRPCRARIIGISQSAQCGGFTGHVQQRANYIGSTSAFANNIDINFDNGTFQNSYSFGGQFDFQYHFNTPYFLGAEVAFLSNTGKALLTQTVDNSESVGIRAFNIHHQFRINYNWDFTGIFGVDATPRTHVYFKTGGSLARFTHFLATTRAQSFATPIPFLQQIQRKSIWGWVTGLGLSFDIKRWLSAFAEYDYYYYGNRALNTVNAIDPTRNPAAVVDIYDQQRVDLRASALRFGMNFKFGDLSKPHFNNSVLRPWEFYFGGFFGVHSSYFSYTGNYYSGRVPAIVQSNLVFNDVAFQENILGGGQLGFQYHTSGPVYVGLVYSVQSNADKALLTEQVGDPLTTAGSFRTLDLDNEFRVNHNQDIAAILGFDIFHATHFFIKVGTSLARITHQLCITQGQNFPYTSPFVSRTERTNVWGWVGGLGLIRDITKWINVFAEYDYYFYGVRELDTLDDFMPNLNLGVRTSHYTQSVRTHVSALRFGFNFTLGGGDS